MRAACAEHSVGVFICRTFIGTQAIELRRRAREALVEMHIAFQRTGGFAGIRIGCEINTEDRKSTRLNSSHLGISYAVFCLKKKKIINHSVIDTSAVPSVP